VKVNFLYCVLLLPLLAAAVTVAAPGASGKGVAFVRATHPYVRYTGRFDARGSRDVRFDWPGVSIEARFGGPSISARIRGDGGLYNVYVDGRKSVIRLDTVEAVYPLAAGLAAGPVHSLRIEKRFEGLKEQTASLKGFYIDAGDSLRPLGPRPRYRIEFVGGSNLLGFGVEADTVLCDTPAVYSDAGLSFGAVAARALGAERHTVAMSGKGLTRNWRSPFLAATHPFGQFYTRAVKNDSMSLWDFKAWVPHVVATCFGTNDFSSTPHPTRELYIAHYRNFAQEVWARHPDAHIVCVASAREPVRTYVSEFVEAERAEGNGKIHFYSFGQVPKRLCGCDWHPNAEAQGKIGAELAEVIRPILEGLERDERP